MLKKPSWILRLAVVLTMISGMAVPLHARMIGVNPTGTSADQFCAGGRINSNLTTAAAELCVDSSGNWIPTTAGSQQLGTNALQFSDVEVSTINAGGKTLVLGAAGAVTVSGAVSSGSTAASQTSIAGAGVLTQVAVGTGTQAGAGLINGSTIPYNSSFEMLLGTGIATNVTMQNQPTITTTTPAGIPLPSGSFLILTSTSSSGVTLIDNGTLTGTLLRLGAATRAISSQKTIMLIFSQTDGFWREVSYGNN